jgi:hypothetical protein
MLLGLDMRVEMILDETKRRGMVVMMGVRQGPENLHDVSPAKMIALFILESLPR